MATLGLGTVQFGVNYGISNRDGKPNLDEVHKILDYANECENLITVIDTAHRYGDSEEILGKFSSQLKEKRIVTKLPPLKSLDCHNPGQLEEILNQKFRISLQRLQQSRIDTLLTHHAQDFYSPNGKDLIQFLIEQKQKKNCEKIGISAYSQAEIEYVIDNNFVPDVVQVPINIFDQQLVRANFLKFLKAKGIEIHVRSAFLQGLIFVDPSKLNPYFAPMKIHLEAFHKHLKVLGVSPAQYALGYLNSIKEIDVIVVGVNKLEELKDIVHVFNNSGILKNENYGKWNIENELFTNPAKWKLQ